MERGYYLLVHEDDLIHALAFILRGVDVDALDTLGHIELADMAVDGLAFVSVDGGICRAHNQNLGCMAGQGHLSFTSEARSSFCAAGAIFTADVIGLHIRR